MEFTADSYRLAAREHLQTAQWLHRENRYHLAHYFSGLSVECMLRAFILRLTRQFDSRHDLRELASESRFYDSIPHQLHPAFGLKFSELNLRWRSNHRYANEGQLWVYLSSIKADFNKRGDRHEINSRTALNLALEIINQGEAKWTLKIG